MKAKDWLETVVLWGGLPITRGEAMIQMQEMGMKDWVIGSTLDRCPELKAGEPRD